MIFVGTGQNYSVPESVRQCQDNGGTPQECLPPWNAKDSIVALDLTTGEIQWITGPARFDAWNIACVPGFPPEQLPEPGARPRHQRRHPPLHHPRSGRPAPPRGRREPEERRVLDARRADRRDHLERVGGPRFDARRYRVGYRDRRPAHLLRREQQRPHSLPAPRRSDHRLQLVRGVGRGHRPHPLAGAGAAWRHLRGAGHRRQRRGLLRFAERLHVRVRRRDRRAAVGVPRRGSSNAGPAIVDGTVYWGNGYQRINTPSTTFYAFSLPSTPPSSPPPSSPPSSSPPPSSPPPSSPPPSGPPPPLGQ